MANGWDSYFHNIPPLSSDPSTLRRTSESEGSISQHIENLIGHHDFPNAVSSHDVPATNSNFNTNYNSNLSIENPSPDCLYQRYCKETPWQADVDQMEKDYLPRCGNSISDFGTDGLLTLGSYPSSFTTDLQELKQDCGMLATSFLEDYSDVSSCSEAEVGETRPSCKFMASNSLPKPKMSIATTHSSSEWLFTDAGNVLLPTQSLCPNMSKTNVILPSTSNVTTGENIVECAQDKMEENVKSYAGHHRPSTTFSMETTTGSETVEDRNDHGGCPDQKREEDVERELTQGKNPNLSMSGHENLAGDGIEDYPYGNEEEQIAATAPNSMTTLDNEQDHSDEKVLRKEIKESFDQKNDNPNPTDGHDGNTREDTQDKSEDLKSEGKESGAFENKTFDEQKSPNPNPTDGQDENMETNFQEKEIQSKTYQSSDPLDMKVSDSKDVTCELRECKSTLKSNGHDVESCLQLSEHQSSESVAQDNICWTAVISDSHFSNASDKNEQCVASHSESCLQPNGSSIDVNPCLKKELTSAAEKKTTSSSIEPFCTDHPVTSGSEEPSVSNGLESCSQSNTSSTDINPRLQKEWTSPAEITNATSPDQYQPLHQSPVAEQTGNVNVDVAENARESLELDTSAVDPSVLGVLYGEPLSREDSSCDADETKLDTSHDKDSSGARPDSNSINYSEGQAPQLIFSIQMRKRLQPVVILKTSESVNGMSNSYHCADCKHTTHNVDDLIEHHHCCHSVHNFQFCKTCDLYLMRKEQAEKHVCCVTKERPQLSSDSNLAKKGKHRRCLRCIKCKLIFSKMVYYVKHMRTHTGKTPYKCNGCESYFAQSCSLRRHKRIPGRCKQLNLSVTDSDVVIKETETPPQKGLIQNKPYPNLPGCYVKLVDISKTHLCSVCGKSFTTADKAKKHFYNIHKGKSLTVSSSLCTTKRSGGKSQKLENETTGLYKCPLCPRLFKYSYNRARHLRHCVRETIYGGKEKIAGKYRCPLCHATFTLPSNRYRHIKTFCFRECVNRLAKERAKSKEQVEWKKTKGIEQKMQLNKSEQNKQPKEMTPKKEALPFLAAPNTLPHYKCNLCPAVFYHASGIYRHMKKHELFKLTGKMFKYRNSLLSTLSKPATLSTTMTGVSNDNSKSSEANGSLALSCYFCEKCFDTPQSLKKHERNHRGQRPYRCLECGKGFKKRASLIGHKSVHQRRIQCTVCRKILPTIGELIKHRSSHLKRGKLQCPDCHQQFQYPAYLLRHLDTHKQKANKTSQLDERPPLKPQQSMESVKERSGPKQLQCSLCKEAFDDPQVLRKHCLTHISGSSTNQCPFCKHNFSTRRYLLRHMIKHTGDKPLSCSNCGKQFYRDLYLKLHHEKCLPGKTRHLVTMESDTKTKGQHQCSYCPRRFFKIIRLKNHHRGHKTNTLLLCSRCGQYFGFTKLNQHQRNCMETTELNTDLSPDGDVCKSTTQPNNVPMPNKKRSNATRMLQFKCSHCTQRFRYRSLLLRHLISHTGVQPYACMHCGHRYRSQIMCLQHEAFCNGVEGQSKVKGEAATQLSKTPTLREAQKPQTEVESEYKCKFCTKTFMKSRSLRRHILTHNEVKPYRCKACDSCFSRYDHLEVHQTRCRGKRTRLEVCIPKISLDDIGKGWQNRFGLEPAEKQETFECEVCSRSFATQSKLSRHVTLFHTTKLFKCTRCGSSFSHEKTLKKHLKMKRCRKFSKETTLETNPPTENVTTPLKAVRNRIIQRIHPYLNKTHKYVCSHCPRAFGNSWQLGVHTRLHTGERPYACDYCGERFIRKDYMQRHSTKCTKKTPILSKSTVGQLRQSTSESPPKGFSCAYCSSRFLLFSQLQEHFLNAHQLETKVPPVSTAPLQHHLLNIPNIKEEPLDDSCDEQLSDAANLICKLDTSLDSEIPNKFSCPECNMSFTNKAGLTGHLRVHTMKCPFNCKRCNRGFWNKSLLRNHNRKCRFGRISERSTTQQLEVPLKAQIDFVLNDSVLVFKDASTSAGTGVLQTNFSHKDDLMAESPQNSEENQVQSSPSKEKKAVQYQCSECDKSFTDGLMLISHLEDHGRQEQAKKRNSCIKCGQVFASQGNLERHMKLHENNRKYSCPDCSKVVYTQSELEIHRTCHDLNRPFACKLCNYRFWTRPSLCNHYREEHPDDTFTCRFCNKAYSVKKSLARHYRRWHKKEQRDLGRTVPDKCSTEQQSSSQVSTTGESGEDEKNGSEDSDSDSAPYFPCHVCGKTFPTSESLEDHQRCHLGEKPHECAECGRCFFQASQLQQHQRMHKSEFQCQACGRGFVSLFALRKHKHTHGKSRPYRCSKCDFSFTGPSQLAEHMSTHREENFPCDICNLVFPSKSSRAEHRKSHSKSGDHPPPSIPREEHEKSASHTESSSVSPKELKYRCGVCGERFRDPEELSEHGCMAAKERPYSCSDCDKHFLHASHLKKHRTTHQLSSSTSEYPCNQCNNSFSSSRLFHSHLMSHVDTSAEIKHKGKDEGLAHGFICPVCHQCFASATELMCHFPTHPDGIFECKICKMTFPSESKLEEHNRSHVISATEFECTDCGQSFWGKDAFCQHHCSHQQHSTMEAEYSSPSAKTSPPTYYQAVGEEEIDVTGEDLYNCPVCSMQFYSKSGLLEHQNKQHQNEKPFECQLCGKTFARKRYLREHERRHRQKETAQLESKFKCTQCVTEFSSAQDLSLHMRLHAEKEVGEYRCEMCYKSFSQWSHLKQHQESHVGQVVYECTECDKAFAFPHLLEEHQQTHAGSSQ
ncbi:zinc finger protein 1035 [Sander lucioperca]|uniref:zinc finger protein 1035 n=1 Tax=Sander lucioperca TaxID=283035 RepID=UPI00125DEF35|nr:zinc finger protein 1035 [Sander lucioperca]